MKILNMNDIVSVQFNDGSRIENLPLSTILYNIGMKYNNFPPAIFEHHNYPFTITCDTDFIDKNTHINFFDKRTLLFKDLIEDIPIAFLLYTNKEN